VRLNVYGSGVVPDWSQAPWPSFLALVRELALHVELHCEARLLRDLVPKLLQAGLDVVVDHFGRPDTALGLDDPGFRDLLTMGKDPGLQVKISAAYRLGEGANGTAVARAAVPLLIDAFGSERLVWGSDWPHTHFTDTMNFAGAVEILHAIVPDREQRQIILGTSGRSPFRIC
jgi:predicted TIM-barrel fold metal-dependent hydrolase